MVVVTDAAEQEPEYESRRFGTGAWEREHLGAWLEERGVEESRIFATCIWRKRIPIAHQKGASTILRTRSGSPGG